MAKSSTSFQPGRSGNPRGRSPLTDKEKQARDILQAATPHAAATLAKAAMEGDVRAAMAVLERVLGKPQSAPEDLEALTQQAQVSPELVVRALTRLAGDEDE
jgi:hypothetical protein